MHRRKVVGAAAVGALLVPASGLLGLTGMTSVASADPGENTTTLIENVPTAIEVLLAGVEESIDVLIGTQSTVGTVDALGEGLADAGSALIDETEGFGPVGMGLLVVNDGVQEVLAPYLGAIDDPSTASGAVDPTDVATILTNGPGAVDGLLEGDELAGGVLAALSEGLRGNLIAGPGVAAIGTPALLGNAFNGAGFGLTTLLAGTSLEPLVLPLAVLVMMGAVAGADTVLALEEGLAPGFEAARPATEPLVAALERR